MFHQTSVKYTLKDWCIYWDILRTIRFLVLKYDANMNDAPVTDLLIQASIKTENHLMDFSDSSWQYCPDIGRSTG